jgi:ferric-dicitrate binding protein FerR (iron transport regulator)
VSTTDTMSDAWAVGTSAVHDLAASAAERATDLASAAAEQLEDLPDLVAGLATTARSRIRPAPRRSWRPWLLLAAGVAATLAVMWWWRRRSTSSPAVDIGPDGRPNPVRDAARSAVGT